MTRQLIVLDVEHVVVWGAVIFLFCIVAVGFGVGMTGHKLERDDFQLLAFFTFLLILVTYILGYLR